jgi:hypothetical protein
MRFATDAIQWLVGVDTADLLNRNSRDSDTARAAKRTESTAVSFAMAMGLEVIVIGIRAFVG